MSRKINILGHFNGELPAALKAIFENEELAVFFGLENFVDNSIELIVTDSYKEIDEDWKIPVLQIGIVDDLAAFFARGGIGCIDPVHLGVDVFSEILGGILKGRNSTSIEKALKSSILKSKSFKLTDPLSFGYYLDLVIQEATVSEYPISGIYPCMAAMGALLTHLREEELVSLPFDIECSQSSDTFFIQILGGCNNLYAEYFTQAMHGGRKSAFGNLIRGSLDYMDLFHITLLEKGAKLMLRAAWSRNPALQTENYPSLIIHQLERFPLIEKKEGRITNSKIELIKKEVEVRRTNLSGGPELFEPDPLGKLSNLVAVKKIVEFVIKIRKERGETGQLALSSLVEYTKNYPNRAEIKDLSSEDRVYIVKAINDKASLDQIEEAVTDIKGSIQEEDFINRVSGTFEDLAFNEIVAVVGGDEEAEEQKTIIKGVTQNLTEENWAVKRMETAQKVKGKMDSLRGGRINSEQLQREISNVLEDELGLTGEQASKLAELIGDNVAEGLFGYGMNSTNGEVIARTENEKLKQTVSMRTEQIVKMKRIMDSMREEITALKGVNKIADDVKAELDDAQIGIIDKVEAELASTKKEVIKLQKQKQNLFEKISHHEEVSAAELQEKNAQIRELTNQLSHKNSAEVYTGPGQEEYDSIKMTNTKLHERIHNLESRLEKADQAVKKSAITIDEDRTGIIEEELRALKEQHLEVQSERDRLMKELAEAKSILSTPKEVDSSQEALKTENKALGLQIKALEQKINILNSQLEKAQKDLKRASVSKSGAEKTSPKLKQLEMMHGKLQAANKKIMAELSEKKTEAHKLALENKTMKTRMHQLERQVANLSKRKIA